MRIKVSSDGISNKNRIALNATVLKRTTSQVLLSFYFLFTLFFIFIMPLSANASSNQNIQNVTKSLRSEVNQNNMLELYTSQGCSSCPPAEKWISKFKNDSRLWKQIVPVNFHVDYWDFLGWKDPFASAEFTKRQREYKKTKRSRVVATPGFMVNGRGWSGWFARMPLPLAQGKPVGVISAELTQQQADIRFNPVNPIDEDLQVHVAILGFDIVTAVKRGENAGKRLSHDFVVAGYHKQPMKKVAQESSAVLSLPDVSEFELTQKAIVIWVSEKNQQAPIQVVADWL
ncbi:DUF1223 domain-containing protein [Aliikangiella coralliicola]|uniref:DUF1223 domain-containing protein n=1 Tax=Aliikangiella coralliicola TaxID=2592383 RepID=A0A545UCC0_9GAMM|nr:DUF1223 domain-containing protein [Aliikangiella coralliicola]TQV87121.1 DUF1223 domain-containing protein [Aliikangiella coralliicola]